MHVRDYQPRDAAPLCRLFYETVHTATLTHYSPRQVWAWAPRIPDAVAWHARMAARHTLVAERAGTVLGFAELEPHGHLDMLYCRSNALRQGIGSALYAAQEAWAAAQGSPRLTTEASLTALPFFLSRGLRVVREQMVIRHGVALPNVVMEKALGVRSPAGADAEAR